MENHEKKWIQENKYQEMLSFSFYFNMCLSRFTLLENQTDIIRVFSKKELVFFLAWFSVSYVIFSFASWSLLFVPHPFLSSCPPSTFMCVGQFQPHLTRRHRSEARGPMKVCMILVQTCADSKAVCSACH